MPDDDQVGENAAINDREVEAAKEEAAKKKGRREPQEGDTPEEERPQTQKLVVDGTDG